MIPPLVKGQVVSDKNEIAGLIDDYDWKRYYGLSLSKIERSNTACVAFKCTSTQDCNFKIRAVRNSRIDLTWEIRAVELEHSCDKREGRKNNYCTRIKKAVNPVLQTLVPEQKSSGKGALNQAKALVESISLSNSSGISEKSGQRFLNNLLGDNIEDHFESYSNLPSLFEELQMIDPEGTYILELEQSEFQIDSQSSGISSHTPMRYKRWIIATSWAKAFWKSSRQTGSSDGA